MEAAVKMEGQMESMQKLMQQVFGKMTHHHFHQQQQQQQQQQQHTEPHTILRLDHALRHDEEEATADGADGEGGIVIPPFHSDNGRNGSTEPEPASHSPSSWETTMFSLAKELETICSRGSSPRDSPNISPCVTPTNGIIAPVQPQPQTATKSQRTVSTASGPLPHQGSLCGSDPTYPLPSGARQVRVRHEETEDRLDRGLTMICRQNSPSLAMRAFFYGAGAEASTASHGGSAADAGRKEAAAGKRGSSAALRYRDSAAKYGIRFRLDLADRDPDNISVSINVDEHILRVFDDGDPIHLLQLAQNTDPQTLSCTIIDGNTLFIKQRSKETMCLEYDEAASSEVSLPISRHDESLLTTTVSLRVPSGLSPDDVSVKTIDDTLMIRTGAGSTSDAGSPGAAAGSPGATAGSPGATAGSPGGGPHQFWVALSLPDGTDTRSVCAWMMKGRLTVKGRMMPTSRRMTCAF